MEHRELRNEMVKLAGAVERVAGFLERIAGSLQHVQNAVEKVGPVSPWGSGLVENIFVTTAKGSVEEVRYVYPDGEYLWEIWAEGYACTGQHSRAQLLAEIKASTFIDAVNKYNKTAELKIESTENGLRHWGCRVFDNEADARKSFG